MTDEELIARLREVWAHSLTLKAADRIEALVKENAELQQVFDMQWKAQMQAVEVWRKAHPDNDLVLPDTSDLTLWLLNRAERLEAALRKLHHAVCGETGFAACVRLDSGKAYPWPALDEADAAVCAALPALQP